MPAWGWRPVNAIRRAYILPNPQMGIRLEFTQADLAFCDQVAEALWRTNRKNMNFNGAADPSRNDQDIPGARGGYGWYLLHGREPLIDEMVHEDYVRNELDGHGAEVRTTIYDHGHLLIQWPPTSDKDVAKVNRGDPFVLVISGATYVDFRGWFIPKDNLRQNWWRDHGQNFQNRPCYAVPQRALFSLIPFFDGNVLRPSLEQRPLPCDRVPIHNCYRDDHGAVQANAESMSPIRTFAGLALETRLRRTCRRCGQPMFASIVDALEFVTGPPDQAIVCPLCGWSGVK